VIDKMKKIVCFVLCVLLLGALAAASFAAGSATITLTPSKMNPAHGEEVTFTVSISEVLNCKAAGIVVAYDTEALELVSGECLVNAFMSNFDASTGNGELAFTSGTTLSGDIFRFTFRVKENANVANDAIVSVRPSIRDTEGAVECQTASLALDVTCTHTYGSWNRLNDGQHGKTCTKCGDVVKENHAWDEGKEEIAATCSKGGLMIYTCVDCGATKEVTTEQLPHAYDNACDTECNNGCGTTREPDHDYSTKWSSDGENHWHQCSVCGDKTDVLPHEPGDPATEWSAQKCRVCDHVLQPALGHTHNYETEWTYDEMGHWYSCKGCEEIKSYANHVYDNSCDTNCNTCGYVRSIQHTMDSNWWFDADGHWLECTVCGEKSRVEPHVPGPEATETSAQVCIDCGYELAPMVGHTHDFGYDWHFNEVAHWQECVCGTQATKEPHAWSEGVVTREPTEEMVGERYFYCTVCDAERREPIQWQGGATPTRPTQPSVSDPEPQPKEFPWWILVVAGGVLVLGFVIFMIVGAIIGQKKTGRFSEK
jgi:hypothetical protein